MEDFGSTLILRPALLENAELVTLLLLDAQNAHGIIQDVSNASILYSSTLKELAARQDLKIVLRILASMEMTVKSGSAQNASKAIMRLMECVMIVQRM